jgi:hypothetical protein
MFARPYKLYGAFSCLPLFILFRRPNPTAIARWRTKSVVLSRRSSIPRRSNLFGCLLLAATAWRRTLRRDAATALTPMHYRRQSGAPRKINAARRSVVCVASISPPAPQRTAPAAAVAHATRVRGVSTRRGAVAWRASWLLIGWRDLAAAGDAVHRSRARRHGQPSSGR